MQRTRCESAKLPLLSRHVNHIRILKLLFVSLILFAKCNELVANRHQLSKPQILLIAPQAFKVSVSSVDQVDDERLNSEPKLQQHVAVVNNIDSEAENQYLRQKYKKLSLQIRDASLAPTGPLFFEHVFEYFETSSKHLLIPIDLEQISPTQLRIHKSASISKDRTYKDRNNGEKDPILITKPQKLVVSVRPHELDAGYGSDTIEFVSSNPIPVETVYTAEGGRSFAVVQTDKPVYKPEDKVRIRVLVVNENLRPLIKDQFRLQVKNPHSLVVEEIRFPRRHDSDNDTGTSPGTVNDGNLFLDHTFEFPPEPMLGRWSVHLLHSDPIANDTTSFDVKEHTLPPFDIEFDLPKYILPTAQNLSGSFYARYNHGAPVQGTAFIKFGLKPSPDAPPKYKARSFSKIIDPVTGRVDFKINSEEYKDKFVNSGHWFPEISGWKLLVEATVIETNTGHKEIAHDTSCSFLSVPYRISFDDSIGDFKPGLNQPLSVHVVEILSGQPAEAGHKIVARYRNQNDTILNASPLIEPNSPVDSSQGLDIEAVTDALGRATFNIGPIDSDVTILEISMKVYNTTLLNQLRPSLDFSIDRARTAVTSPNMDPEKLKFAEIGRGEHRLVKHDSQNGYISLVNKTITQLSVGDQFISDILIQATRFTHNKIYYIIMTRGRIIALDKVNDDGLVNFMINDSMLPSIRLVVFALTHDPVDVLSDSLRINVKQDMDCGMKIRYMSDANYDTQITDTNTFRPSDKGKLAIQARYGDSVSLIGVDSAVYTMNKRPLLGPARILERIRRLDSGCGASGGRNNIDVFHNAGLLLYKDSDIIESANPYAIGSYCLTKVGQMQMVEDIQAGYPRPQFIAWSEMARNMRHPAPQSISRLPLGRTTRNKREVDIAAILKRYKDPLHYNCCYLGTIEDTTLRRNCSVRAQIVAKREPQTCARIFADCCRIVHQQVAVSSMISDRHLGGEQFIIPKLLNSLYSQMPQFSETSVPNIVELDNFETETLVRSDFRETWLFESVKIDSSNGSGSINVQLPHSITSWSVAAMALNRFQPMCLMNQPMKLRTFQDIFLHVSMPYKLVQGEQIDLVATIFNYSPRVQEVFVYTYGINDVCSEAEPGERSARKRIRIEKNSSQSVLFPMIPLKIGRYSIRILALAPGSNSSDIVERKLNVVARGKPVIDETTITLDPLNLQRRGKRSIQTRNLVDEIDQGLQHSQVRLAPTRDSDYIVPQTKECVVSAIGDRLGQSVQTTIMDVEKLIRIPHGSGEQVMIYMGPTLYTARYLSIINKLVGDLRWEAIRYIQSGYKRILNYRREEGAFSAFSGSEPSVWLTAFVTKMLCQTEKTKFIAEEIHVDKTVIKSALKWLIKKQDPITGSWIEPNPVYHREMLGGVLKENALTAFVTITLNECAHHSVDLIEEVGISDKVDAYHSHVGPKSTDQSFENRIATNGLERLLQAIRNAHSSLERDKHKATRERNPYVLALTAYALSFDRPQSAKSIMDDLLQFSERSQSRNHLYWRGDYPIETAAYALQALIKLAPTIDPTGQSANRLKSGWSPGNDATSISNWLLSRRSYTGAFESTQDTVVALEALSKLAQAQSTPDNNIWFSSGQPQSPSLLCNVTVNNRTRRSIEFSRDNAQILQSFKLETLDEDPINGDMLEIFTSGNGLGTMSVKFKYNVFYEENELCRFDINVAIEEWQETPPMQTPNHQHMQSAGPSSQDTPTDKTPIIGDDYFKMFDESTLADLGLKKPSQLGPQSVIDRATREVKKHARQRAAQPALRFRRLAEPQVSALMDNSVDDTSQPTWGTRLLNDVRSRIHSFFWSKPLPPITTRRPSPTPPRPHSNAADFQSDATYSRRTNTSRRSANGQAMSVPLISRPASIPPNANFNTLSVQVDTSSNETSVQNKASLIINSLNSKLMLLLRICTHHIADRDSRMSVIEVGILSGFRPYEPDLEEVLRHPETPAMKYEISTDRSLVLIYLHYVPHASPYCLNFRIYRESLVYNLQSGYIRIYEYDSPTHSCSNFYTPSRVSNLIETQCDSTGQVCQCASKSLCPATNKLLDISEVHSINATSAREKLIDLICSDRYDFVSMVKLEKIRHLELGKMFKIQVKVKTDIKGNLTTIMDIQRSQKSRHEISIQKPPILPPDAISGADDSDVAESTPLDQLSLSIDSSCVKLDQLLLHLGHPNLAKQGSSMILFGRLSKLEKRYFKTTKKLNAINSPPTPYPKAKPRTETDAGSSANDHQRPGTLVFEDAQQLQYSTTIQLDQDSILHDIMYQSKIEPRESIYNLIRWIELRSTREKWSCPAPVTVK